MSTAAGANDPFGIPEGMTFEQAFNQNFEAAFPSQAATGTGGGSDNQETYNYDDDPETRRQRERQAWEERQANAQRKREQDALLQTINATFQQYGLGSLYSVIEGYVRQDYNEDAIVQMLRQTPEYKDRFPAMEALAQKKRAITEGQYIAFERNAAQLERAYGLPTGMLGKDAVTRLLTNEVSADELQERVVMAASGAYEASADVKQQFRDFYGIDSGGLTAYFLDPERAMPLLQKQYVAAQIGAEAAVQSINIGVAMAEELQMAGIDRAAAREGFGRVAQQTPLSLGRGDVVSQQELIRGNLTGEMASQEAIARAAGARTGAFEGRGQILQTERGAIGLGSAATR